MYLESFGSQIKLFQNYSSASIILILIYWYNTPQLQYVIVENKINNNE